MTESYRDYFIIGTQLQLSNHLNIAFGVDVEKQYYNTSSWQNVEGTEVVEGYNTIPGSYTDENFRYNDGTLLPLWDGTEQPDLNNPFDCIQGNGRCTGYQTTQTLTKTPMYYIRHPAIRTVCHDFKGTNVPNLGMPTVINANQ